METTKILSWKSTKTKEMIVGKWYKFDLVCTGENKVGYGKFVSVIEESENSIKYEVEKYFELPTYRPYATHKWFDDLSYAN